MVAYTPNYFFHLFNHAWIFLTKRESSVSNLGLRLGGRTCAHIAGDKDKRKREISKPLSCWYPRPFTFYTRRINVNVDTCYVMEMGWGGQVCKVVTGAVECVMAGAPHRYCRNCPWEQHSGGQSDALFLFLTQQVCFWGLMQTDSQRSPSFTY